MSGHQNYYIKNDKYSNFLETQDYLTPRKYINKIEELLEKGDLFLDVGCGTGLAIEQIKDVKARGIDISEPSIKICKQKGLSCKVYDGRTIPFKDDTFNAVGCYDVLEHVDNPELFLDEMLRVLKPNGYLIIVCPNFLSITNGYHYRTKGLVRKSTNCILILSKLLGSSYKFDKMATTDRPDFHPDDDACNVTNPIDIMRWGRSKNLSMKYWSARSFDTGNTSVNQLIDRWPLKYFLGSSFLIFNKA